MKKYLPIVGLLAITAIIVLSFDIGQASETPNRFTPQKKKITSSQATEKDIFGFDVAVSGDYAAVGIPHNDTFGSDSGAVEIFERDLGGADNWGSRKFFNGSSQNVGDHFGISVDIDDETLAVGAYFDNQAGQVDVGSVYLFYKDQGGTDNWGEVKKLLPTSIISNTIYGISVALHENTLVVGTGDLTGAPGSAYVYYRGRGGPDRWGLVKRITPSEGAAGDQFGWHVDVYDDKIIVGAPFHNSDNGAAFIFSRDLGGTNNWGEVAKIQPNNLTDPMNFGKSVTIYQDTAAVSGPSSAAGGNFLIFEKDHGGIDNWGFRTQVDNPGIDPGDVFGEDIKLDGNSLIVGATMGDGLAVDSGLAYLFERDKGGADNWGQTLELEASDGFANDSYGFAASMDSSTMIVGAWLDDDACPIDPLCNSGSAYIYYLSDLLTPTPSPSPGATDTPSPSPSPTNTPTQTPTLTPTLTSENDIYIPLLFNQFFGKEARTWTKASGW